MEAVGFAASIYSLLEKVMGYINAMKDANEERKTLINELVDIKAILSELESKAGKDDWRSTLEALMTHNGPRDQLRFVLERLDKKLSAEGKLTRVTKPLAWYFVKEDIREILSQIERIKSLFVLALENKHM